MTSFALLPLLAPTHIAPARGPTVQNIHQLGSGFTAASRYLQHRTGASSGRGRALTMAAKDFTRAVSFQPSSFEASSWPYSESDLKRMDESPDIYFYSEPRFVTHIDDGAIKALTAYYDETLPEGADLLDLCSSWISHLPDKQFGRVVGVGMNARELEANQALTEFVQADLNSDPRLPFKDESFDAVLNVVSVDYLSRPREVFAEMHRVLRPGGQAIMSFSNRCFPTKVVRMWLDADDAKRQKIVASYFNYSPLNGWKDIMAIDISPTKGGTSATPFDIKAILSSFVPGGDPMFVVRANKVA